MSHSIRLNPIQKCSINTSSWLHCHWQQQRSVYMATCSGEPCRAKDEQHWWWKRRKKGAQIWERRRKKEEDGSDGKDERHQKTRLDEGKKKMRKRNSGEQRKLQHIFSAGIPVLMVSNLTRLQEAGEQKEPRGVMETTPLECWVRKSGRFKRSRRSVMHKIPLDHRSLTMKIGS